MSGVGCMNFITYKQRWSQPPKFKIRGGMMVKDPDTAKLLTYDDLKKPMSIKNSSLTHCPKNVFGTLPPKHMTERLGSVHI